MNPHDENPPENVLQHDYAGMIADLRAMAERAYWIHRQSRLYAEVMHCWECDQFAAELEARTK